MILGFLYIYGGGYGSLFSPYFVVFGPGSVKSEAGSPIEFYYYAQSMIKGPV